VLAVFTYQHLQIPVDIYFQIAKLKVKDNTLLIVFYVNHGENPAFIANLKKVTMARN